MPHTCHAKFCRTVCAPEMFMCSKHWRMVPRRLQQYVCNTYRMQQFVQGPTSRAWLEASANAVRAVAVLERPEERP